MHCMRDAPAVERFLTQATHPELLPLIRSRLDDLAAFDDVPLSELVNIHILDLTDSLDALNKATGLSLAETAIELCTQHAAWFELTVIVGDDGFGHVIFIPTSTVDGRLLAVCNRLAVAPESGCP